MLLKKKLQFSARPAFGHGRLDQLMTNYIQVLMRMKIQLGIWDDS